MPIWVHIDLRWVRTVGLGYLRSGAASRLLGAVLAGWRLKGGLVEVAEDIVILIVIVIIAVIVVMVSRGVAWETLKRVSRRRRQRAYGLGPGDARGRSALRERRQQHPTRQGTCWSYSTVPRYRAGCMRV